MATECWISAQCFVWMACRSGYASSCHNLDRPHSRSRRTRIGIHELGHQLFCSSHSWDFSSAKAIRGKAAGCTDRRNDTCDCTAHDRISDSRGGDELISYSEYRKLHLRWSHNRYVYTLKEKTKRDKIPFAKIDIITAVKCLQIDYLCSFEDVSGIIE